MRREDLQDVSEMFWWLNYFNPLLYVGILLILVAAVFLWAIRWTWLYKLLHDYFVIRRRIEKMSTPFLIQYYSNTRMFKFGNAFNRYRGRLRVKWIIRRRLINIKSKQVNK